ncbi:MAG: TonB-dependent receptor [Syntrophothermus sp.]
MTCITNAQTIDISGLIKEKGSGEALIGANVSFYKDTTAGNLPVRGSSTNKYGFYSVPNLPKAVYILKISSIGYETYIETLDLTVIKTKSLKNNYELAKSSILYEEVVIEDKRLNFSQNTSTIQVDPEQVQKLPSLGGETDIFRALQLLPGVSSTTEISTGIYVRGSSASENLTLIDGVNVYNPSHLGGFASTFNADVLREMKLIKGTFPAEYGGRLSSVLDITMREGSKEKFTGNLGVNSISSRLLLEGPIDTSASFILSGRVMYLNKVLGLFPKLDNIPRYSFYDFNTKVSYNLSDKDKVFFSGFFSSDNIKEPPNSKDVGFDIEWSNATANLTWTNVTSATIFSNTSLMYTNYTFSTVMLDKLPVKNPLDFYTKSVIHDFEIKRDMQFYLAEDHSIKSGAELILHQFNTTTSDIFFTELKYKMDYGKKLNAFESSLFIQDEYSILANLKSNVGFRLYYFQNAKFMKVEPRASLTYYLLDKFIIRGAFAQSHQTLHLLTRSDIYLPTDVWYPSTKDILPASSTQGSLSFEAASEDRNFLFTFECYYKDLKNLYEYKPDAQFTYGTEFEKQVTPGKGHAYGFELFFNKRIGSVTGWLGYTLAWTKRKFDNINNDEWYYPRFDRRHDITFVLSYKVTDNLNIGGTWVYGTGQAFSLPIGHYSLTSIINPQETAKLYYEYSSKDAFRLPAFHKLDVSIKYEIKMEANELQISLDVYNAYNRYNAFTKYIGYKLNEKNEKIPVLKQFTLFPFLPTLGINYKF